MNVDLDRSPPAVAVFPDHCAHYMVDCLLVSCDSILLNSEYKLAFKEGRVDGDFLLQVKE